MIATLYEYRAIVTKVYDGDTIWADIDLGFYTWKKDEHLRLLGINAPEVRGIERPQGLVARDALAARIMGKEVIIRTEKDSRGKYGRFLAWIWLDGENINRWMVEQGYATAYTAMANAPKVPA